MRKGVALICIRKQKLLIHLFSSISYYFKAILLTVWNINKRKMKLSRPHCYIIDWFTQIVDTKSGFYLRRIHYAIYLILFGDCNFVMETDRGKDILPDKYVNEYSDVI